MSNNKVPSDEDFARAKAALKLNDHGLSEVRDSVLKRYSNQDVYEFFIFYSRPTNTYGAYVFYGYNHQIIESYHSGLSAEIRSFVLEQLSLVRRVRTSDMVVDFTYDSNENVEQNYESNYYNRLR